MQFYVLIVLIVAQDIAHRAERRDLYNRIMSKDYKEFKSKENVHPKYVSAHKKILLKWRKKNVDGGDE